jgi:hypothetical protein
MSSLQSLFEEVDGNLAHDLALVLVRLVAAAVLGAFVAVLYRVSRPPDQRNPGFAHTLVLLAPLIAMVTAAVGQNVAAAFTLVGTLALVRFRAAVRDTRDMAFVIFSVAVGMAMGALNLVVALAGAAVVGAVVCVLRAAERHAPTTETATLRLWISPANVDPAIYTDTLARYAHAHAVRKSSLDRQSGVLELKLAVSGVAPDRSPALLADLLAITEVVRATFSPEEQE